MTPFGAKLVFGIIVVALIPVFNYMKGIVVDMVRHDSFIFIFLIFLAPVLALGGMFFALQVIRSVAYML